MTATALHHDAERDEWYVSTTGSNLAALHGPATTLEAGLCIDRARCVTTRLPS